MAHAPRADLHRPARRKTRFCVNITSTIPSELRRSRCVSGVLIPVAVRAKSLGGGIATAANWLFAFFTTKEFEDLEIVLDRFGAFWLFAGICLVGVVFVFFFVPETKGRSLEEIEAQLAA